MHSRGHGAALDVGRAYSRSKRARVRLGLRGCGVQSPRGARGSAPEAHSVPFAVRFLRCLVVCPVVSALARLRARPWSQEGRGGRDISRSVAPHAPAHRPLRWSSDVLGPQRPARALARTKCRPERSCAEATPAPRHSALLYPPGTSQSPRSAPRSSRGRGTLSPRAASASRRTRRTRPRRRDAAQGLCSSAPKERGRWLGEPRPWWRP